MPQDKIFREWKDPCKRALPVLACHRDKLLDTFRRFCLVTSHRKDFSNNLAGSPWFFL